MNMDDSEEYMMLVLQEEEDRFRREVWESTPEVRKNWDLETWIMAIDILESLLEEDDCPILDFSAEQWKEIIVEGKGMEAQYCPCQEAVLALLTKDDFCFWSSYQICLTLMLDGEWLASFLPLEEITQEDFEEVMINELTEEEALEFILPRFPNAQIPEHLVWPFSEKQSDNENN